MLRGPQGTLFGKNATGGLANYVTRKPTDQAGGYLDTSFGERNLVHIEGAINGPVWGGVDGRLAFQTNHYDPLFKNTFGPASDAENGNDWSLRGQLLFKLPDSAQLLLLARFGRTDVHAGSWEEYATKYIGNGVDVFVGPNENVYGTCAGCNASGLPNSGPFTIRDSISGYTRLKSSGLTAKYTRAFGSTTLTVVGDYSSFRKDYQEDSDASPVTLFQFFNGSNVDQQSIEARLNGGDKQLNWTAGLYGLRINGKYYEGWQGPSFFTAEEFNSGSNPNGGYVPGAWPYGSAPYWNDFVQAPATAGRDAGGIPSTRSPYELLTKSYAAFAQVEYRLSDLVGLTVGARVTSDKKDFQFTWFPYEFFPQSTTGNILTLTRLAGAPLTDYSNSRSDSLVSGKAELDFHLAPGVLTYVSYNRGVKGGGPQAEVERRRVLLRLQGLPGARLRDRPVAAGRERRRHAQGCRARARVGADRIVALRRGCRVRRCDHQERAGQMLHGGGRAHQWRLCAGQRTALDRECARPLHVSAWIRAHVLPGRR